ncbi:class I SAM-dependent methyltransferase [Flavobacterium jejuense]|uniref:Class I SAM-dependent methyltransferase n=1 Tax=Flavobacterium jejuense TaxID=1544455 RepID=A0ABX0IQR9_9FLAO|nr:class I SAM-dependent methyltransferase [Flavobacterium jejuense]NHN25405.1 class I SAM-dependent methyltransferase [Flavobacterium jejuense]
MNYFNLKNVAERYSKGRPSFHNNTIEKVKTFLKIDSKIDKALDVACGTGLSTKVLLHIARSVYGTDLSIEMLNNASSKDQINYSISPAENQPFNDDEFNLITVCSGIHWFKIDAFLNEANRLLKSKSFLIIYDNYFISYMVDVPEFERWFPDIYLKNFPSPKRNDNYNWSSDNLSSKNFSLLKEESFKNPISFTKADLILYFTTQSNITEAISNGDNYRRIELWLDNELTPFFEDETTVRTINFGNWIKYIQRNN